MRFSCVNVEKLKLTGKPRTVKKQHNITECVRE